MCGIFGIVGRENDSWHEILARVGRSLAHRGPDDSGTIVIESGAAEPCQIGFAHTRLSVLDLSPLGHQPMQDPVTGNWIVYNGEIYTFREWRKELEAAGTKFRSHSDTEVILSAYRVWGEACFSRLRGMFALALWDATRKRLLLVRDPVGIKPLYYSKNGGCFLFASELRTLLDTGLVPRKLDAIGLLSYLEFGSVYEPWTIVDGVSALAPGCVLTLEQGEVSCREYWNPLHGAAGRRAEGGKSAVERLPDALRDAVLSHLVSDVPVGVFLSGGIDSSSLVALLSQNGVCANTFSLVFREEEYNEAQYSREVARRFKTDHHEIPVSQNDMLAMLPDALKAMDQPTVDGINSYLVSAKTRAAGIKVALSGLGADEMFAGYSNFRRVPDMQRLDSRLQRLPLMVRKVAAAALASFAGKNDRNRKLAVLLSGQESFVHPYFLARMLFGRRERQALMGDRGRDCAEMELDDRLRKSVAESESLDPVNQVSYLESYFYMRNTLLRDADFMSMAHGLEVRVPFLDRELVDTCFRISGKDKLQGNAPKSLLRSSLGTDLPEEIVKRPKRGFTLPFERWLRGEMKPEVEKTLRTSGLSAEPIVPEAALEVWSRFLAGQTSWTRPWALFVLARWCEQNL